MRSGSGIIGLGLSYFGLGFDSEFSFYLFLIFKLRLGDVIRIADRSSNKMAQISRGFERYGI